MLYNNGFITSNWFPQIFLFTISDIRECDDPHVDVCGDDANTCVELAGDYGCNCAPGFEPSMHLEGPYANRPTCAGEWKYQEACLINRFAALKEEKYNSTSDKFTNVMSNPVKLIFFQPFIIHHKII